MTNGILNETQLLGAAGELLKLAGYKEVSGEQLGSLNFSKARLYEDRYAIVCLVVFATWAELAAAWADIQADFVQLLSKYLVRADAKTWDAYLVLLTPAMASDQWRETLLSPLLPIAFARVIGDKTQTVWSLVYQSLEKKGVGRDAIEALVKAYEEQRNAMEALRNTLKK